MRVGANAGWVGMIVLVRGAQGWCTVIIHSTGVAKRSIADDLKVDAMLEFIFGLNLNLKHDLKIANNY